MTTDSADAPHSARVRPPAAAAVPATAGVHPPRGPARETLPPPRPGPGVRQRAVAPLVAADCLATVCTAPAVLGTGTAPMALGPLVLGLLLLHSRAGLYRPHPAPSLLGALPVLLGRAAVCWCAVAAVLAAVRPAQALPPALLAGAVALHTALVCGARALVHRARRAAARRLPRATLIVGAEPAARQLAAVLHARPGYGMRPVGVVVTGEPAGPEAPPAPAGPPRLTTPQDITRAVIRHTVRDAVFTVPPHGDPYTAALLRRFIDQGAAIWLAGAAAALEGRPPPASGHLGGFAWRRLETAPPRHGGAGKRALDLVVAVVALVVAAPVLLGGALAVRLADGPGVLCRQERVGRGGRGFLLLTLRTRRPYDGDAAKAPGEAADDLRTSRVGRLLRRTGVAGLPRWWNVLRGDLSLVGPCPETPRTVERCTRSCPEYGARHRMAPGLTGLARVHGLHGGSPVADRARYDNLYIDSWSWGQDVRIMLRAVARLPRREGR
ncbi:sugar transferase [Streptomyces sp. TM32]|uniref:sugar transferase n=1 Tax=Streptomyces sp. TM32 TaxID=1652669 RepID=UPI00101139F7|nr:sugar transferase [Streptomyces sp. TM32]RXS86986.1 sugar transferase [Streptomyces sp. TM32]